ncbi:ATP-binding protein [Hellea balneolensis]|uniref:ATP-binding protein n=1 Tax=Hellea balneolensis TaxID=287478 RepID=UPI00047E196E|nr:biotin carboxylase N-terminal domain-containing protein [Hellea balneolensis]
MTKQITKILIANRGEIACRVIKTARKMGIATVAVYSDADRKALHVRMADEAVHIGASPAIESYLVVDKIIAAATETGADAIHPGYGFLSENPDFVRACEKAGITFIGPSAESMEAMGLKDAAKKLMDEAGVPITPGYHGKDQDAKLLKAKAGMIGYPVLIKAVAGGGGKGMRKVEAEADFDAMLASCQREAKSSFGNDDVLIEKYIQSPRHIEVQVFGDTHGNVVHMFERDCSLQRRHQKVIEEAPAPGMTEAVRKAMTEAAVKAAKAVDYVGAGTVEFIVDGSGKLRKDGFWFMEMNTRLQVEHPVTEMITGLDLVELQIRVAQGEKLPKQGEIKMEGHAVEARLYAEDPANDFLPSVGRINTLYLGTDNRVDSAYESYDRVDANRTARVSQFYDPMIAKVITHCDERKKAIGELAVHLYSLTVEPIKTNAAYLYRVCQIDEFLAGNVSTVFLAENHVSIIETIESRQEQRDLDVVMGATVRDLDKLYDSYKAYGGFRSNDHKYKISWRLNSSAETVLGYYVDGRPYEVKVTQTPHNWTYLINGLKLRESHLEDATTLDDLIYASEEAVCWSGIDQNGVRAVEGVTLKLTKSPPLELSSASSNALTAPMPGKIIAVNAKAGDAVKAGEPLIIMEAMKMEMTLETPRDGVVAEVSAAVDALVSDGEMLLALEPIEKEK